MYIYLYVNAADAELMTPLMEGALTEDGWVEKLDL